MILNSKVLVVFVTCSLALPATGAALTEIQQSHNFSISEAQSLFEHDESPVQMATLSSEEMKETEGAWIQFSLGGAIGAAGYGWGYYRGNYAWNTARFLGNVGTGALIGGSFGALGGLASGGARFIPSLTNAGANIWRVNSASANFGANRVWRR